VEGFRIAGARVLGVEDAVAVVVGIGAAIGILEAVLVLRLVGALVGGADDAVAVGVVDRAAVGARRAGLIGAPVEPIRDAVAVAVAIRIGALGDDRRRRLVARLRRRRAERGADADLELGGRQHAAVARRHHAVVQLDPQAPAAADRCAEARAPVGDRR